MLTQNNTLCQCGCNQTVTGWNYHKKQPIRYINGHYGRGKGKRRSKDGNGYILIYRPDHPFSTSTGYVREHRLVMEEYLGRYLSPDEHIHHINKITTDNRIENLQLVTRSEHMSIEQKGRKRSQEYIRNISLSRIGNRYALGHKLSEEARHILSVKNTGKRHSIETRLKMSRNRTKKQQEVTETE